MAEVDHRPIAGNSEGFVRSPPGNDLASIVQKPRDMTQQFVEPDTRELSRSSAPDAAGVGAFVGRLIRGMASQDWLITLYFTLMMSALAFGSGPGRPACMRNLAIDASFFFAGIVVTRGGLIRHGSLANALVYRFTVFLPVFLSYFQLRDILPAVSSRAIDAQILEFDLAVFGVEPSLAWDKFVNPHTTEWFAFFYFGYFFILIAHVFPMMLAATNRERLAHFSLGIFVVFCTGHLVYMLVPGYGPYRHLAGQFQNQLDGGLFWALVKATVEAGGAQKDIFPSLHTAAPSYFAMFSFIHRRAFPFKYTWPIMAFVAFQIICATMFLRWHYLVDIFAGLTLAAVAAFGSKKVIDWEKGRRQRAGVPPVFELLEWRKALGVEAPPADPR